MLRVTERGGTYGSQAGAGLTYSPPAACTASAGVRSAWVSGVAGATPTGLVGFVAAVQPPGPLISGPNCW